MQQAGILDERRSIAATLALALLVETQPITSKAQRTANAN